MNEVSDVRDTLAALDRRLGEIRQHMVTILEEVEAHAGEPGSDTADAEATGVIDHPPEPSIAEHAPPAANGPSAEPDPEPPRDAEPQLRSGPGADAERLQQLRERLLEGAREIDALRRLATEPRGNRVVFEGEVTLMVRGIDELQTLLALEEGLQNRPGIERAAVSTYAPGEARFHLTLTEPLELAAELEQVIPVTHTLRVKSCLDVVVELGADPSDQD